MSKPTYIEIEVDALLIEYGIDPAKNLAFRNAIWGLVLKEVRWSEDEKLRQILTPKSEDSPS